MINNNPLEYIEQTVAVEDLLIAGVSRKLRNDIGYDLVYLSSPNDFELTTGATGSGLKFIGGTTHRLPIQSDWTQLTFISSVANQIVYVVYAELRTHRLDYGCRSKEGRVVG